MKGQGCFGSYLTFMDGQNMILSFYAPPPKIKTLNIHEYVMIDALPT